MTTPLYIAAAEDLRGNAEQWAAYESRGSCVILAGPGSGKTKTITIKIARLLAEEVKPPRRIACITYSNACVAELRSRLGNIGIHDSSRALISTVHSFCLTELVLPYSRLAGMNVPDPLVMARQSVIDELFARAVRRVAGNVLNPRFVKTPCEKLRRVIPDKESDEWRNWGEPRHTAIVEAYERELLASGVLDFDALVLAGLTLVEQHSWVRAAIKAKYPIIVIDEYQDLGLPLHRMVMALLLHAGVRIIAVGDPDQSIYGFTGAQPRLLRALAEMRNVESIRLHLNYRCANRIIEASRTLLNDPPEYRAHDAREGLITPHETGVNVRGQAEYALQEIVAPLLNANPDWRPGVIAFLYRTKNEGDAIAGAADAIGLNYFRLDNGSPIPKSRLSGWLVEVAKWCADGWQTGSVRLSDLMSAWRLFRRSLINETDRIHAKKAVISALFGLRNGNLRLEEWLTAIRVAFLDEMIAQEVTLADERDIIDNLSRECVARGRLADFTVQIFGDQGKSPDQINLITLHSSKGLEFQAVIMVGLEEGEFPNGYALRDEEQLQEARRLFYVGVTRAKNQVHFLYNQLESRFVAGIIEAT
ncbi:ATP-dependent helicase [Oryzomonas rubra]|uniref:DNA 3'-5' helicase n=1 Tax=Oryzomonas rubra TaxID=2509454 RepID=A0A5A9XV29_9BACT|nr:ATP-dependent helicase [Oryzomonas rubra]KAA0895461.1 ATP-dependent helicase [Oryzomonas rubra]